MAFRPTRIPFRLKVLVALTEALRGVNPTNGYEFDVSESVFRGRIKYGEDDPLPMISILEAPIPADPIETRGQNHMSSGAWELLIQGFVEDDDIHPTDPAQCFMAEVKAALVAEKERDRGNNILGMQGRISEMYIGQGSVRPADEASDKGFFWLTLTLRVVDNLRSPYD
jgi:hypothetical protein